MSKMNLLVELKGYDSANFNSCNTSFSRNLQHIGIDISEESIQEVTVAASATVTLFTVAPADAKKFIYLEADGECDVTVNSILETTLKTVVVGSTTKNAVYLRTSDIETIDVTNNGADDIKIFYIAAK